MELAVIFSVKNAIRKIQTKIIKRIDNYSL